MTMVKSVVSIALILLYSSAFGQEVYKWKDANGTWHISQGGGQTNARRPIFWITVERITIPVSGWVRIDGTVTNQSSSPVKGRRIIARASDVIDGTSYQEFFGFPAGSAEIRMEPQQSASFSVSLQMPPKSRGRDIRFEIAADGDPSDVNWQASQQMKIW